MQEDDAKPLVKFAVMPPIMGLQRPPLPLPLPGVQLLLLPLLLVMALLLEVVMTLEAKIAKDTALETGGGESCVSDGVEEIIDDMPLSLLQITEALPTEFMALSVALPYTMPTLWVGDII